MNIRTFRNKRSTNKYIQMKRYNSGNYYFRQFMHWETERGPVTNYIGIASGAFRRGGIKFMKTVLEDYEEVMA